MPNRTDSPATYVLDQICNSRPFLYWKSPLATSSLHSRITYVLREASCKKSVCICQITSTRLRYKILESLHQRFCAIYETVSMTTVLSTFHDFHLVSTQQNYIIRLTQMPCKKSNQDWLRRLLPWNYKGQSRTPLLRFLFMFCARNSFVALNREITNIEFLPCLVLPSPYSLVSVVFSIHNVWNLPLISSPLTSYHCCTIMIPV